MAGFRRAALTGVGWGARASGRKARMTMRGWGAALLGGGLLGLAACGGPALTPLQAQYRHDEERALRYHAKGELPLALQAFESSLRWAEIADDRPAILAQTLNMATTALALGEWSLAEQSFQRAWRLALAAPDPASALRAELGLAQVDGRRGRFDAARSAFQRALAQAREQRDQPATLVALNGLGLAQKGLGQREAAQRTFNEAETLARASGERRLLAATLANQASLLLQAGEAGQAEIHLEEAIQLDRATENLPGLTEDLALLAQARQRRGSPLDALELYRRARTIARHTGQIAQARQYDLAIERLEQEPGVSLQRGQVKSVELNSRPE